MEIAIFRHAPDAKEIKKAMSTVFDDKGVPFKCQSDNGPPFQSEELKQFARKEGFILKHITPEWPRANGEVERFNRTLKATAQKGSIENKPIKEALQPFIRMYRATPHSTTGVSPYEALFGRKMKVDLPVLATESNAIDRNKVERGQDKMRERPGKSHKLSIGDMVLIRQPKRNKLTPAYDPSPAKVVEVKGSMVTARSDRKIVTQDGSRFKRIHKDDRLACLDNGDSSEDELRSHFGDNEEEGEHGNAGNNEDPHIDQPIAMTESQQQSSAESMTHHREPIASTRPQRTTAGVPPVRYRDYAM